MGDVNEGFTSFVVAYVRAQGEFCAVLADLRDLLSCVDIPSLVYAPQKSVQFALGCDYFFKAFNFSGTKRLRILNRVFSETSGRKPFETINFSIVSPRYRGRRGNK